MLEPPSSLRFMDGGSVCSRRVARRTSVGDPSIACTPQAASVILEEGVCPTKDLAARYVFIFDKKTPSE